MNKGFTVEVSSRYEGWWRYNVALMCGCFDAEERRTGFESVASHIADVGANLPDRPADTDSGRTVVLETEPCDHLLLYIYVVPHTLPAGNDIDETEPFEIDVTIAYAGRKVTKSRHRINQWSGASFELKVGQEGTR